MSQDLETKIYGFLPNGEFPGDRVAAAAFAEIFDGQNGGAVLAKPPTTFHTNELDHNPLVERTDLGTPAPKFAFLVAAESAHIVDRVVGTYSVMGTPTPAQITALRDKYQKAGWHI